MFSSPQKIPAEPLEKRDGGRNQGQDVMGSCYDFRQYNICIPLYIMSKDKEPKKTLPSDLSNEQQRQPHNPPPPLFHSPKNQLLTTPLTDLNHLPIAKCQQQPHQPSGPSKSQSYPQPGPQAFCLWRSKPTNPSVCMP